MLKRLAYKKIIIVTLSLIFLLLIYFFPSTDDNYNINTTLTYSNPETIPIYLVDNNNNLKI